MNVRDFRRNEHNREMAARARRLADEERSERLAALKRLGVTVVRAA